MSSRKILVVDDEQDAVDWLAKKLESVGYDVVKAMEGHEAIAKRSQILF